MSRTKCVRLDKAEFLKPSFAFQFHKILKYFQSTSFLKSFTFSVDEYTLSFVSYEFQRFLDQNLGKESPKPKFMVKLPHGVFQDFRPTGALSLVLKECLTFQGTNNLSKFELTLGRTSMEDIWALVKKIDGELRKEGYLLSPKIYFSSLVGIDADLFRGILASHGGVDVEDVSQATHIVEYEPEIDSMPESLTEDFFRALSLSTGNSVRVHWLYFPDSYDDDIPLADIDARFLMPTEDISSAAPYLSGFCPYPKRSATTELPRRPAAVPWVWKVSFRFLTDCELFNEWGNERDYEISEPDYGKDTSSAPSSGVGSKRKSRKKSTSSSGAASASSKDQPTWGNVDPSATDKLMSYVLPPSERLSRIQVATLNEDGTVQMSIEEAKATNTDMSPTSSMAPLLAPESSIEVKEPSTTTNNFSDPSTSSKRQKLSVTSPAATAIDKGFAAVAGTSEWFSQTTISEIERAHVGFIRIPKPASDEIYLGIRSRLIELCNDHSHDVLTVTEARKKIPGEVNLIAAVHEFLIAYRIINSRDTGSQNSSQNKKSKHEHHRKHLSSEILLPAVCGNVPAALTTPLPEPTNSLGLSAYRNPGHKSSLLEGYISVYQGLKMSMEEFLRTKIDSLNAKMEFFESLQEDVEATLESVQVERRNFQIQHALWAFNQPSGEAGTSSASTLLR